MTEPSRGRRPKRARSKVDEETSLTGITKSAVRAQFRAAQAVAEAVSLPGPYARDDDELQTVSEWVDQVVRRIQWAARGLVRSFSEVAQTVAEEVDPGSYEKFDEERRELVLRPSFAMAEDEDTFEIALDLPGVSADAVVLEVDDRAMRVTAYRPHDATLGQPKVRYHRVISLHE